MLIPKRLSPFPCCPKPKGIADVKNVEDSLIFVMADDSEKEFDLLDMLGAENKTLKVTNTFGNTILETNYIGATD